MALSRPMIHPTRWDAPDPAPSVAVQTAAVSKPYLYSQTANVSGRGWDYWWPRIAGCESVGNVNGPIDWRAHNPRSTASGGFEDLDSTWGNYGGYARAMDAPVSVQMEMNAKLFVLAGFGPWSSSRYCWA